MSVTNTEAEDVAAMFDTTTGMAFGPTFDSGSDIDDFLDWVKAGSKEGRQFTVFMGLSKEPMELVFVEDVRSYKEDELSTLKQLWEDEA